MTTTTADRAHWTRTLLHLWPSGLGLLAAGFQIVTGATREAVAITVSVAALCSDAGYLDQAHFGHELRAFTGLTPTWYVEVRRRFLREHPGHVLDSWPLPAD